MARPTVFTKEVLQKLEHAYSLDCTDQEACFYANISPASLYNYQATHEQFLERKQALKQNPVLKARMCLVSALESSPTLAFKYLERKRSDEFGPRASVVSEQPVLTKLFNNEEVQTITREFETKLKESLAK